jgi:hypothetical protein
MQNLIRQNRPGSRLVRLDWGHAWNAEESYPMINAPRLVDHEDRSSSASA